MSLIREGWSRCLWNAYLIITHHMQCIVFADSAGWLGLRGRLLANCSNYYICDQPPLGRDTQLPNLLNNGIIIVVSLFVHQYWRFSENDWFWARGIGGCISRDHSLEARTRQSLWTAVVALVRPLTLALDRMYKKRQQWTLTRTYTCSRLPLANQPNSREDTVGVIITEIVDSISGFLAFIFRPGHVKWRATSNLLG